MSYKKHILGTIVLAGVLMAVQPVQAWLVPILSAEENARPNLKLLVESEITRWKQEALKYQEMIYTDMIGKVGGGSLGQNNVVDQMQEAAKDGASVIGHTTAQLKGVSNLSDYASAKAEIEMLYFVKPEYGRFYTLEAIQQLQENQRVALNDLAVASITQASVDTVGALVSKGDSTPKTRAKDISKAKDMNAMMEMLLAMDRRAYERSLQISALEAADAGVQAMLVLKGISATGQFSSGVVETESANSGKSE